MPEPRPTPTHRARRRTGRQRLSRRAAATRPRRQVVVAVLLGVVGLRRRHPGAGQRGGRHLRRLPRAGPDRRAQRPGRHHAASRGGDRPARETRERAAVEHQRPGRPRSSRPATEADTLDILAGTVPVTGPGIRITIEEVDGPVDIDSLLDTVQELRTAGAEAMQINGEVRVVAQTSFEDGVGGIDVDGTAARAAVRHRRDRRARPRSSGGLTFAEGPIDQLEDDGAERRRRRAPVARHRERRARDQAASSPSPTTAQ